MRFQSQAEMDQNARGWIAFLLIALAGISTVVLAVAIITDADALAAILKLLMRR